MTDPDALSPPAVDPAVYDEEYFRTCCGDADAWEQRRDVDGIYAYALELLGVDASTTLVDLGSGRGELVVAALKRGAPRAIGVEYSPDAVRLAHDTASAHDLDDRAEFREGDIRATGLDPAIADRAAMLDVVEHLTGPELADALVEARRLLRPGGRILVHTMPNRLIYDATYRWLRRLWPRGRRWPADPRNEFEHAMHVGELSARQLEAALVTAGFADVDVRHGELVYFAFVPSRIAQRLLGALDRVPALRRLTRANLLATATRPA